MDKEKLKEAMKWYKRKIAEMMGINIDDVKEEDMENVEMLTEKVNG